MGKKDEVIEEMLDNVDDHEKRLKKLEEGIGKILMLLENKDADSSSSAAQPVETKVTVEYKDLKNAVYDAMGGYYKDEPDHTGILSESNLKSIHDVFWKLYHESFDNYHKKAEEDTKKYNEEEEKHRIEHGINTVEQVAEWAPEYPIEIQRTIRYIGMKILPSNEPVESAHRILKIWGDALMQITNQAEPKPPTLSAWGSHQWRKMKARLHNRMGIAYTMILFLGLLCMIFISMYQSAVMDLDRTNRIFYNNVIRNEKRTKDYHELDSIIHSNSFFKTYRTLDK